jgi:Protein of unknown function (DUF1592)/Protein of unknown function (DUF1588)/Protein of unknown function (DUF1595)/Protein of unknown function (DUF1587)
MPRTFSGIALVVACATAAGACVGDQGVPVGGGSGAGAGVGGGAGGSTGAIAAADLIPARIRRLSNAEYDASVQALLGTKQSLAATTFPPDARQGAGYTLNDAQRVDPVLAKQLAAAAQILGAEARANGTLARLAPCATPTGAAGVACAGTFIQSFGAAAYRRPLASDEAADLAALYDAGAADAAYVDGVELVVRGVLQSAGFLYLTELGDGAGAPATPVFTLSSFETANALAYLVAAGPPDPALLEAARAGQLATGDGREQQARRLLQTPAAGVRLVRVVREWLGIDGIGAIAKDTTVYPDFAGVRPSMDAESVDFINDVARAGTGTVAELLGADFSVVDAPLAAVYGVAASPGKTRTSLAAVGRRGILNQGAFLSVFAHAGESAPVLRGVAVLRRIGCVNVPSPTSLNIVVTPPVPDPTKTTRQRFAVHATDKVCQGCHAAIDGVGFSFEQYDAMGRARATDNGVAVDTTTVIAAGADFDGNYASSNALATALAQSPDVRACVARQLFRASVGRSDDSLAASEEAFLKVWQMQPADAQGNLVETIVAFVRSPLFAQRRGP